MELPIRLRIEQGPGAGRTFALASGEITIGRQEGNTIVIDDRQLSRRHARITDGADGPTVTDLDSANGTFVNDRRIDAPQPLRPGDRLRLGEMVLLVEVDPTTIADPGATALVPLPQAPTAPIPAIRANLPRLIRQDTLQVYALDQPEMTIGRQADNAIVLTDTQVSRQHARLTVTDAGVTITDLDSANGTRVNGTPIVGPTPLHDGDTIQIGMTQFQGGGMGSAATADGDTTLGAGAATPPGIPPPFLGTAPLPALAFPPAPSAPAGWQGTPPPPPPPPPGAFYQSPPPPARRSNLPFLLGGLAALALLLCVVGGGGLAYARLRGGTPGGTATPARTSVASIPLTPTAAGTATPATAPTTTPTAIPTATPAPPTATVVAALPTLAPTATVVVVPPTPAPTATAQPTPTRASPSVPATTPTPRLSPTAGAGGATVYNAEGVGLSFTVPAGWTKIDEQANSVTFLAPSREAQFTARWSTSTAGTTAERILQQELAATVQVDPTFNATRVAITPARIGGQNGSKTDQYNYTARNGPRTELDVASVLPGSGQYFFGFLAVQGRFSANESAFVTIIDSIQINPPR
jgi:pSer/pThr/pTyr-binding forkhead associated (FHA) protein